MPPLSGNHDFDQVNASFDSDNLLPPNERGEFAYIQPNLLDLPDQSVPAQRYPWEQDLPDESRELFASLFNKSLVLPLKKTLVSNQHAKPRLCCKQESYPLFLHRMEKSGLLS
ncbi:hypothetical protein BWQ96_07869 [Gracilariopsis chorda]|uniref:Uncharacterized protein n=1 Tax=Gracilariopsis chorda TaxID=448386 RepID=A0A2V3IJX1_9FLOR|nr:hypothetical protein BWQ96_07869 [Gracilariopsis chorda]|eukprot:PXF42349.1 hypothetical protein BWQ96_07869 [Gracilariopsis chorda]